jgi:hypothetical protein
MEQEERSMIRTLKALVLLAVLCAAGIALAAPPPEVASGTVVTASDHTLVLDTAAGRETYEIADGASVPADLAPGDVILVRLDEPGSWRADQVLIVKESVEVTAELDPDGERAVLGTVSATSPDQLLVETTTGEQAFVVNPEKLFPPLPTPDQRVAVTYRTLELHPPLHMATGLVVLPDDFRFASGNVRVTSEPVVVAQAPPPPAPEPLPQPIEEAPALPAPEPMMAEPIEPLPQTATPFPLMLGAGALLLALAVATRHDQ